jgi:hypothetical protein
MLAGEVVERPDRGAEAVGWSLVQQDRAIEPNDADFLVREELLRRRDDGVGVGLRDVRHGFQVDADNIADALDVPLNGSAHVRALPNAEPIDATTGLARPADRAHHSTAETP